MPNQRPNVADRFEGESVLCPKCAGKGRTSYYGCTPSEDEANEAMMVTGDCRLCFGVGRITAEKAEWGRLGKEAQRTRVNRLIRIRTAALAVGCSATSISDMEGGYVDPAPLLHYLA